VINKIGYLFFWLVSLLPLSLLNIFSKLLAFVTSYRKNISKSNIKIVFPNKSKNEINSIYYNFKFYLINLIFEIIKMFSSSLKFYEKRVKISNIELINNYFNQNKSVIIMGGHYNNWEWAGPILSQIGNHHFVSVYKKLSNNFFNNFMIKLRSRFDIDAVEMNDLIKYLISNKNCKMIALISDQNPIVEENTKWLSFFGHEVPVIDGPEKIAKKFNFPVLFCDIQKVKNGFYNIKFEVIEENPRDCKEGDITKRFFKRLEYQIKQDPNNYLWSHNRWKHKK
tara:strand:+ start:5151 stop:5993 length:843 start_codon:yes stop_codon:yes gene_type:complete